MVNVDIGTDRDALGLRADATWGGVTVYVRPNVKDRFFPTLRVEYYDDPDGFTTGVEQKLWGVTFTGDYRLGAQDGFAKVLLRPEFRYDKSDADFFSHKDRFRVRDYQATVGLGLVAYF
jgi:hypothetical protein